jgi:streptogramin lyase
LSRIVLAAAASSAVALAQVPDGSIWSVNFSGTAFQSVSRIDSRGEVLTSTTVTGFTPFGLAVDPSGNLWAGSNGSTVAKYDRTGTSLGTFPVGSFPQSVASDANGDIWVVNRTSNSVMKLSSAGAQQFTVPLPAGTSPIGVIVDLFGHVWVSGFHSNTSTMHTMTVLDSAGTVLNTYTYTATTPAFGFSFPEADNLGNIWVANQAQSALLHINGLTGAVMNTTPITMGLPRGCAVDGLGFCWLANQGFAGSCVKVDQNGVIVNTFLPPTTSFTTVTIDGNGDPWVFGFSSPKAIKLWQVDASSLVEVPVPSGGSAWGGDSAAFHLANVILPGGDFDGDGTSNANEIAAGTNPFEARSTPLHPLPIQSTVARPGATFTIGMRLRPDANLGYVLGISLGNGPTVLPDSRTLPLSIPVVLASVGTLNATGDARYSLTVPNNTNLTGLAVYFAYVTLDPTASLGVRTISNDLQVTIR